MESIIKIRVSATLKGAFEQAAAKHGMPMSAWARWHLIDAARASETLPAVVLPLPLVSGLYKGMKVTGVDRDGSPIEEVITHVPKPRKARSK